jgi:CRP/FNR family transcriptional regulator, cyclic AMP receptor protein
MISPEMLRRYPCFAGIKDESLKAVAMISEERSAAAGAVLFLEDQPATHLFIVTEGEVDIRYPVGGAEHKSVDTLVGGDLMVWSAVVPPHKTHSTAVARKPVRLVAIDAPKLRALCEQDTLLGYRLMSSIAEAVSHRLNGVGVQLAAVS